MTQLLKIALRDLGRNRRRSFFSSLAVGMGLALLLLMASVVRGEMNSAVNVAIRLQTGHLQIRSASYDESKSSLKWEYLVENPQELCSQIASLPPVKAATPRLFASGILSVGDETSGVRVLGIDPLSEASAPYRQGVLSGEYLAADDRQGVLIGQPLAEKLGLSPGQKVSLSVNTSNGEVAEQLFTIRGVYSTNTYGFDSLTVLMPLAKAQTITQTENHASAIFILLEHSDQTDAVAAALQTSQYAILDWREMNELILQTEELSRSYMVIFYLIVLAITATVIVNTLIMSVFERTREIGILAAIGMKSGRIMTMFLAESTLLAVGGILLGLALGYLAVYLFNLNGFYVGNIGLTMLISNTIYAELASEDMVILSLLALVITLLAGLYPAVMAARLEPVAALRAEK